MSALLSHKCTFRKPWMVRIGMDFSIKFLQNTRIRIAKVSDRSNVNTSTKRQRRKWFPRLVNLVYVHRSIHRPTHCNGTSSSSICMYPLRNTTTSNTPSDPMDHYYVWPTTHYFWLDPNHINHNFFCFSERHLICIGRHNLYGGSEAHIERRKRIHTTKYLLHECRFGSAYSTQSQDGSVVAIKYYGILRTIALISE